MRGPSTKPRWCGVNGAAAPATLASAVSPGRASGSNTREACAHEGAIDAHERHDIANRGKAYEIDGRAQIRLGDVLRRVPAAVAQAPIERDDEKERHARGAEIAEARCVVGLIGIDVRKRGRRVFDRMMIEHDDIETGIARALPARRSPPRRNRR